MTDQAQPAEKPHWLKAFFSDLLRMPRYLKVLMIGAFALLALGLIGHAKNTIEAPSSPETQSVRTEQESGTRRGFISGVPETQPGETAPATVEKRATWSGRSTRVGAGFIVGFIVGWIFRFFLKTMALLTAAGAVVFGALSYFSILNVDLSTTKTDYENSLAWVSDQGKRLAGVVYEKMNATVPTAIGAFFGFRRRG